MPESGEEKGWVSNFHKFLTILLEQISSEPPEVMMIDEEDYEAVDFEDAQAVIAIITPALTAYENLVLRLNEYGIYKNASDELVVNGIPGFYKVLKGPYDPDIEFEEFEDLITYDFYLIDPLTGDAQEFKRFFGNNAERGYWMKLVDMAYDLNQYLTHLGKEKEHQRFYPREKTVYLASTGLDMVIQRDVIKRELMRHGYKVLPNHSLPKEAKSLENMVREDLKKCRLSIHLIGEDYGYKPKGSDLSVVEIQNRIGSDFTYQTVEYNKTVGESEKEPFSRLIWITPELKNVTERQKLFIEDLKGDAATLEEAEVLQIPLQELKHIIREELMTGGRFSVRREMGDLQTQRELESPEDLIYLLHDKRDVKETRDIEKYLTAQGYRVVYPTYEGDIVDLRYLHQENLRRCDGALIYFGSTTEDWIRMKLQDLMKAPGFGRLTPMKAKAIYVRDRKNNFDVEHFLRHDAMVLGNTGEFNPQQLEPFLNKMEATHEHL